MVAAYMVSVLNNTALNCSERIELEVRFARELERLLGGPDAVAAAYMAAAEAEGLKSTMDAKIERWNNACQEAALVVRSEARRPDAQFDVRLDRVAGRTGVWGPIVATTGNGPTLATSSGIPP